MASVHRQEKGIRRGLELYLKDPKRYEESTPDVLGDETERR